MKIKNLFAILLAMTLLTCMFVIPTSAKETTKNDVEIIIIDEVSEATKEKIERYFVFGELETNVNASTYGLTCTLLGHKIESATVETITHKVRTSSPRCVSKLYNYQACTRCDYETSTLMGTEYIVCCA